MIAVSVQERSRQAVEYLYVLRSLAAELERAMRAIAHNSLLELEESVANQQTLSTRLGELVDELCVPLEAVQQDYKVPADSDRVSEIRVASEALQNLNRRYAALLKHSSHSVALMASLFNSCKGQFQEASGPRLKQQTWSCQM
jgi:hypothetical protein